MKKTIAFILALCLTGAVMPPVHNSLNTNIAMAADEEFIFKINYKDNSGYFNGSMTDKDNNVVLDFQVFEDHAEVTGSGRFPHIDIPAYFPYDIDGNQKNTPVTRITEGAFCYGVSLLKSVSIPDTVEYIGKMAFAQNQGLTSIELPDSVKEIDQSAFLSCRNLKTIKLSSTLETIGTYAFSRCESLDTIELPKTLKNLKYGAFFECKSLESIELPYSLENIEPIPFAWCSSLKNVTLPSTLTTIPEQMFQSCSGLENFDIPNSITEICTDAFCNCENLRSVTIPESVTKIGDSAFNGCKKLETIAIPPSVESLGKQAFDLCDSLQSVKFIKKVTFTKDEVKEEPYNLKSIEDGTFNMCKNLESVNIPPSVEKIGNEAFRNCESLKMVILPNSVSKIGTEAFMDCSDLQSLIIMNKACVIGEDTQDYNGRTICNEYDYQTGKASYNGTINGFEDSSAETYAKDNDYAFDKINFEWGKDNWAFINSSEYFGDEYSFKMRNPKDIPEFLNNLSDEEIVYETEENDNENDSNKTEKTRIINNLASEWDGSCYGMAATSILSCYGILKPSKGDVYTSIYDFSSKSSKTIPENLKTLINYYFLLQHTDYINQLKIHEKAKTESEKINDLVSCVKDGYPTLLLYGWKDIDDSYKAKAHAVVAYGLERCSRILNGKEYDRKVLIYDPNNTEFSDDYCLYFKYADGKVSWAIPGRNIYSDRKDWHKLLTEDEDTCKILFATNDIEIINYHGINLPTANIVEFKHFFPILQGLCINESYNDISDFLIKNAEYKERKWNSIATASNYTDITYSDIADGTYSKTAYAMDDPDSGYIVEFEQPEQLGFILSYENTLLQAEASNGTEARFAPSGCVSVCGDKTDYELNIVLNEGYTVTDDWYGMSVKGSGVNEATLEKSENGYILNADNLKDVHIKAYNDEAADECVISTDYTEVFIYEKDADTIGATVDTDNNGTYETEIETSKAAYESPITTDVSSSETTTTTTSAATSVTETTVTTSVGTTAYKLGDVTGDGIIDGRDATDVLTDYARTSTGKGSSFNEEQKKAADVNNDGIIDGRDATRILTYYAKISVGEDISISEFSNDDKETSAV